MMLWVVGQWQHYDGEAPGEQWEFVGAFDSESMAVAACRDDKHFVMGPFLLNASAPRESVDAPAYYPALDSTDNV